MHCRFVRHCILDICRWLLQEEEEYNMNVMHVWTDGAASQFRCVRWRYRTVRGVPAALLRRP